MADPAISRAQLRRARVLTAARRLFLQRGFADTSMEAIRIEAGVSKETLYRYYAGKDELFADVLRELTLEHVPRLSVMSPPSKLGTHEPVRAALLSLAHELVAIMMQPEYLALLRIVVAEVPRLPHVGALFRSAVPAQSLASVAELLGQLRDQGDGAQFDAEAAARMLLGSLLTYALLDGLLATSGTPLLPQRERLAAIVDLLLRAMGCSRE